MRPTRGGWIALVALVAVSCSDDGATPDSVVPDSRLNDRGSLHDSAVDVALQDAVHDATPDDAPTPLKCFDFSLNPSVPLAIDGVFGASSPLWRRPHDDPPVCPATALTPAGKADVPFVAYAFCNNDKVPHTFDFEMLAQAGPQGEQPLDDPYLFLYTGQAIPADPLQCLAVNDDIPDALDVKDSEITGVSVPAGGAITMVGTTYTFDPTDGTGTGYYILVVTVNDP